MMKYLLAIFLLCSTTAIDIGIVTFVRGIVTNTRTKMKIRVGDRIFSTDKLLFTPNASLSYRVPKKGAFVMDAKKLPKAAGGKLLATVNTARGATKYNLAGKKGGTFSTYQEIMDYFAGGGEKDQPKPLLVIGTGRYIIAAPEFKQGDKQFFYISYTHADHEGLIRKKLSFEGDELLLTDEVFSIEGTPISTEGIADMKFNFVNMETKENTYITDTQLVFVSKEEVKEQLKAIISAMEGEDDNMVYDATLDHLANLYGTPDNKDVKQLLKEEFDLTIE